MPRVALTEGLEMSRIVYGMWRLADDGEDRSEKAVRAKVDACLEQGLTTFDQADIYGDYESEALFGKVLKADKGLRGQMEIASKCGIKLLTGKAPERTVKHYDTSAAHIAQSVDASLSHMGIDTLDLLMIHRPDPFMDHEETGRALDGLVDDGKARFIGVSNFKPHDFTLLQSAMRHPLVTNQIEISVLHTVPFTDGDLAFLQERGLKAMAWSPLGGGALFSGARPALFEKLTEVGARAGADATAAALSWLMAHPSTILPVVGTNNVARIAALSDAFKVPMDRQTWFEIYELSLGHEVP
ncbi:MAG: aldo/keto reductase [Pseudomonadota bacterium]